MGFPIPGVYTVFKGKKRKLRSPKDKAEWSHGQRSLAGTVHGVTVRHD